MISRENLDKRICDVEEGTINIQTYREFIAGSEDFFGMDNADLDKMNDEELTKYLDFLDELWIK